MEKSVSIILIALIAFAAVTMVTISVAQAATVSSHNKDVYVKATTGGTVTYTYSPKGTGTVNAGSTSHFTVPTGTTVTFTAIPKTGYKFAYWSGASQSGNTNPLKIVVKNSDIGSNCQPLTATFVPNCVLPEYSFGALAALGACFASLQVYKRKASHILSNYK